MGEFVWEARARTGELRKGVMEAETADMVHSRLKAQQLTPQKVKKKSKEINLSFGKPVSEKELVIFVRQFATTSLYLNSPSELSSLCPSYIIQC